MGFAQKSLSDGAVTDSSIETQKCVMAGMTLKPPLKRVRTRSTDEKEVDSSSSSSCTTPTSSETRIPAKVRCPAAPRKAKAKARCSKVNGVAPMEFFDVPQDLESVFNIWRRVSN
ncbi:unnamed protein product [Rhodiola kirilowii]